MAIERTQKKKSATAEKTLVTENLHLVRIIAHKIAVHLPPHIDVRDLIGAGTIGLLEAATRFDETKGVQFNTFASIRIRGAIVDELRSFDCASRSMREKISMLTSAEEELQKELGRPSTQEETAEALGITIEEFFDLEKNKGARCPISIDGEVLDDGSGGMHEVLADACVEDPVEAISSNEVVHAVRSAIDSLPLKMRMILSLYYLDGLTLKEIGVILEITEGRVCQMHDEAIKKARILLEKIKGV